MLEILRDKIMDYKFMYIPDFLKQNQPICRSNVLVENFGHC